MIILSNPAFDAIACSNLLFTLVAIITAKIDLSKAHNENDNDHLDIIGLLTTFNMCVAILINSILFTILHIFLSDYTYWITFTVIMIIEVVIDLVSMLIWIRIKSRSQKN